MSAALAAAADALGRWPPDRGDELIDLAHSGRLAEIADVEPVAAEQARVIVADGPLPVLQAWLSRLPDDLRHLIVSAGLPIETVAALHGQLGVTTRSDVAAALRDRVLDERVPANARIARALRQVYERWTPTDRNRIGTPLGRAWRTVTPVADALRDECPAVIHLEAVGSLRRVEPFLHEISLLCTTADPNAVVSAFAALPAVTDVLHRGRHKASVLVSETQINLQVTPGSARGLTQLWTTGSEEHLSQLARHAGSVGLTLRLSGLWRAGQPAASSYPTDADVYAALELPFIAPELRQGTGEVEAAKTRSLPDLISIDDVRGDLHVHSDWSDGRDSIEDMVVAAHGLGYEYIAITDHSPSARTARTVNAGQLARQAQEIDRIRARVSGITVLRGVEVDILPDGTLDLDDSALGGLDLVVASLHDAAGQAGDRLTERYVAAMRHPLVNIIAHPTNRIVGYREAYTLDFDTLFATAIETGTILEIDGAPIHLDMDGAVARRAVAAGALISVDSDAHGAQRLGQQMRYGIGTARRGWAEARHVVNTRPVRDIRDIIARKRQRLS